MNQIKIYNNFDDIKLQEIKYGLETIYLTIVKTIIYILIALLLNTIKELLFFILTYGLLRLTGFGVHAKKSLHCWISSTIIFVIIPLLIKYVIINSNIIYAISIIFTTILIIYAPADTEKRPLINKKKRIRYKIMTAIISISYLILIIIINNNFIKHALLYSLVLEGFLVTPLIYKLFGVSYKNYKNYKRKENKK
jgi:accessory gene regulator B